MQRKFVSALIVLLAFPAASPAQTMPPRAVNIAANIEQNLQQLDLRRLPAEEGSAWVVAHITLTGDQAAHAVGEYIDGETGKMVATGGPITFVATETGRCDVSDILIGKLATPSWAFSWVRPRPRSMSGGHGPPPNQGIAGGTFVVQVFPDQQDFKQFGARYAIPDDWQKQAKPAFDFLQSHLEIFQGPPIPEQTAALRKLVSGDNPLLSIAAARALADMHQLDSSLIDPDVLPSRDQKQAALCVILAKSLPADSSADALGKITAYIRAAQSPTEAKGLLLAVHLFDGPNQPQLNEWGRQIVKAVQANPPLTDQSDDGRFNAAMLDVVVGPLTPRQPRTAPAPTRGN